MGWYLNNLTMSWLQSIKQHLQKAFTPQNAEALPAYQAIVAAARQPALYMQCDVPDTPQGRFEMVMLHGWLVIDRLAESDPEYTQSLFDLMFDDFDLNLRELGVGDLGVGKRVKGWAAAFYGRAAAYKSALADEGLLADALARNLFAGEKSKDTRLLAFYVARAYEQMQGESREAIKAGKVEWPVLNAELNKE